MQEDFYDHVIIASETDPKDRIRIVDFGMEQFDAPPTGGKIHYATELSGVRNCKVRESFELKISGGKFRQCSQGSKNLFCGSRRIFRAEPGCHFFGRIFFHLVRNRAPRLKS